MESCHLTARSDDDVNDSPEIVQRKSGDQKGNSNCIYVDGEFFYDVNQSLLEDLCDKDSHNIEQSSRRNAYKKSITPVSKNKNLGQNSTSSAEYSSPVLLEETPLPQMFIPGNIAHIYTHCGAYKIAFVPRQFQDLQQISLAGNMLKDHMATSYYEALLECLTVRNAVDDLPKWTGFDEESTCSCCASRFTWASTSNSEAQEARDKHNCRACGNLVCDPCSNNRAALPQIGITLMVRVCDRCYHNTDSYMSKTDRILFKRRVSSEQR
eukprot:CAMPEP_0184874104 /NCGR_PEP_ID=MMETSP0580-20130426/42210_1 /TAXON_ID=1118495 /ORGANISM="Dactyliosolen fragilissimus" /LENGTH=266 /DNA_ID=CAMNT_0027377077 /DNA_START=730 /DNA_END=1527 /DNA_ORIENTATION=-